MSTALDNFYRGNVTHINNVQQIRTTISKQVSAAKFHIHIKINFHDIYCTSKKHLIGGYIPGYIYSGAYITTHDKSRVVPPPN